MANTGIYILPNTEQALNCVKCTEKLYCAENNTSVFIEQFSSSQSKCSFRKQGFILFTHSLIICFIQLLKNPSPPTIVEIYNSRDSVGLLLSHWSLLSVHAPAIGYHTMWFSQMIALESFLIKTFLPTTIFIQVQQYCVQWYMNYLKMKNISTPSNV